MLCRFEFASLPLLLPLLPSMPRWVVERILACRPVDQNVSGHGRAAAAGQSTSDLLEFQVQWEGSTELTWIPAKNFAGGKRSPMLRAFLKKTQSGERKHRRGQRSAASAAGAARAVPAIHESDDEDDMPLSRFASVPAVSAATCTTSPASAATSSAQPAIDLDASAMEEYIDHVSLPTWLKLQEQMSNAAHGEA